MGSYFYRVSNNLIRSRAPNIKRICVNYLIGEVRGVGGRGIISLQYLINECGFSQHRGGGRINSVFRQIMCEMIDNGTLTLDERYKFPPYHLSDAIVYTVNPEKFDIVDNFTKLTDNEFNAIIRNNSNQNKESLMALYLYIKSFYHQSVDGNRPIGFYQSLDTMREHIGLSRYTAIRLLNELMDKKLLFKHYVGSRQYLKGSKEIQENVPNIYVPNLGQSQNEIKETYQSTVDIMKDIYGVSKFLPFMSNSKEI